MESLNKYLLVIAAYYSGIGIVSAQYPYNSQGSQLPGQPVWQQAPSPSAPTMEDMRQQQADQNQQNLRQMGALPPTQQEVLENWRAERMGRMEVQTRREKQFAELYAILSEDQITSPQINEANHQDKRYEAYAGYFTSAAQELTDMLSGKKPLDLKRAVFLSENPSQGNSLSYTLYCKQIARYVAICKELMAKRKLNPKDKDAKNWVIQQLYADTLHLYLGGKKVTIYPFRYDFEDFRGEHDIRKLFVTKLLRTHTGQCHSMPLLYAILAQELHTTAFVTYSPNHSYIVFPDKNTNWRNFETTSGVFTTPGDVISSGYIKEEALENGLYLRPNPVKETISNCLSDLVITYQDLFGNDDFVRNTIQTILRYYPRQTEALMLQSNLVTSDMRKVKHQYQNPAYADLDKYPVLKAKVTVMRSTYDRMDALGFADMPEEAYQTWLRTIERLRNVPKPKTAKKGVPKKLNP